MFRTPQVNSKELQDMFELVERTNSWDSVNWNKFKTVPGDKEGHVKLKNKQSVAKYIFDAQRTGRVTEAECDTDVLCEDGYIPCHRVILMQFSPVLKELIVENMKEIGTPSFNNKICIALKDFKNANVVQVLQLFYEGFIKFPFSDMRAIISLLDFLKVQIPEPRLTTEEEQKKKTKTLKRFVDMSENESDEEADDGPNASGGSIADRAPNRSGGSNSAKASNGPGGSNSAKPSNGPGGSNGAKGPPSSRTTEWVQTLHGRSGGGSSRGRQNKADSDDDEEDDKFVKVPPGSLVQRKSCPRIHARGKGNAGIKKPSQTSVTKPVEEPQPSTSKAALAALAALQNDESEDVEMEELSEYSPDDGSSSESEHKVPSDDEKDEDFSTEIPNLRSRRERRRKRFTDEGISPNSSLTERVKTNARYPQRNRKESARRLSLESVESVEARIPNLRERKKIVEQESAEEAPNSVVPAIPPSGSKPRIRVRVNINNHKCYFCRTLFPTDLDLLKHATAECGAHLNGRFDYKNRKCLICQAEFLAFSHYGLIRHVHECFVENSGEGGLLKEDNIDHSSNKSEEESDGTDDRNAIIGGYRIYSDEKVPIGDPKVILEKLSDERISKILASVNQGKNVVIPRIRGYSYVKVTHKSEILNLYPNATDEEILERILIMEQEQKESTREHEERRRLLKLKAAQVVPPLILNRSRLVGENDIASNAQEIYEKLLTCHCGKILPTLDAAKKCLTSHGLKRCWVCCEYLTAGISIKNHFRTTHSTEFQTESDQICCPVCKAPTKCLALVKHMKMKHLNQLLVTDSPMEITSTDASVPTARDTDSASELLLAEDSSDDSVDDYVIKVKKLKQSIQEKTSTLNKERNEKRLSKAGKKMTNKTSSTEIPENTAQKKAEGKQLTSSGRKRPAFPKDPSTIDCKKPKSDTLSTDAQDKPRKLAECINAKLKRKLERTPTSKEQVGGGPANDSETNQNIERAESTEKNPEENRNVSEPVEEAPSVTPQPTPNPTGTLASATTLPSNVIGDPIRSAAVNGICSNSSVFQNKSVAEISHSSNSQTTHESTVQNLQSSNNQSPSNFSPAPLVLSAQNAQAPTIQKIQTTSINDGQNIQAPSILSVQRLSVSASNGPNAQAPGTQNLKVSKVNTQSLGVPNPLAISSYRPRILSNHKSPLHTPQIRQQLPLLIPQNQSACRQAPSATINDSPPALTVQNPSVLNLQNQPVASVKPTKVISTGFSQIMGTKSQFSANNGAPWQTNAQPSPGNSVSIPLQSGTSISPIQITAILPVSSTAPAQPRIVTAANTMCPPTRNERPVTGNAQVNADQSENRASNRAPNLAGILSPQLGPNGQIAGITVSHDTSRAAGGNLPASKTHSQTILPPPPVIQHANTERALVPVNPPTTPTHSHNTLVLSRALACLSSQPRSLAIPQTGALSSVLRGELLTNLRPSVENPIGNEIAIPNQRPRVENPIGNEVAIPNRLETLTVGGGTFTVHRRRDYELPHPNTIVSLSGIVPQPALAYDPQPPLRAILPPPGIAGTGSSNVRQPQGTGNAAVSTLAVARVNGHQPDPKSSPLGYFQRGNVPPPQQQPNVKTCPDCKRRFNSEELLNDHFC